MLVFHFLSYLGVLFAICSFSTCMLACCSGDSMEIWSSDNSNTCMINWAFSLSVASFVMPAGTFGMRFDDSADDDGIGAGCCCCGGGCCGFMRGSARWRGSDWNGGATGIGRTWAAGGRLINGGSIILELPTDRISISILRLRRGSLEKNERKRFDFVNKM